MYKSPFILSNENTSLNELIAEYPKAIATPETRVDVEDIRKFGGFYYWTNLETLYNKIGIDPMNNNNFNLKWMEENIQIKSRMIKSLLLDQSFICGLGNIYVDEILWSS